MFINLNKLSDTNLACRKIAKDRNDSRQPSLSFFFIPSRDSKIDLKGHLNGKNFKFLTRRRGFKTDSADG